MKPNLSRLPLAPLLETAAGLEEGARKYGPWNWRGEQVNETIYADAAIRHLMQFIAGEDIDPDSGLPHVTKAIAGLLILRDAQMHNCSVDDRLVNQNLNIKAVGDKIKEVHEKYEQVPSNLKPRELTEEQEVPAGAGRGRYYEPPEKVSSMTHEDGTLTVWSDTPAGGGAYELKSDDVGKEVVLRNGRMGIIHSVDNSEFPINVCDCSNRAFTYTRVNGYSHPSKTSNHDVIRIYHVRKAPNNA